MEPSDSSSASNWPQGEGDSDHSEAEEERLPEAGLSSASPEQRSGYQDTSAPARTLDASHSSRSRERERERDDGGGNHERSFRETERQYMHGHVNSSSSQDQETPRPPDTDNLAVSFVSATFDAAAAVELSSSSQERRSRNQGGRGHGGGNRERSSETERQQPKRPDLAEVQQRTNTFHAWPHQNTHPADQMAEAGFYFEGHSDQVRCFHCGGGLRKWQKEDNPWVEHKSFFPHCSFIRETCRRQAPQSDDDEDESDHALRQKFKTPVHESRAEAGRECDHPATIRPTPSAATAYEWSENGLAISGSPPNTVSSAQDEPALGVVDPDQAAAVPLAGRSVLSEGGLWASGDPPVQDQAARCLHCGEKERELLQDCGHKCLCRHCFFCPYVWIWLLNANQGVMVCFECGRPFHSISVSSMNQVAAGLLNARHRRFTCSCLSRRG